VTSTELTERARGAREATVPVVDADVHNAFKNREVLKKYLPAKWHAYHDQALHNGGWPGATQSAARPSTFRNDAWPEEGTPGSSLELLRAQLLDRYGVHRAVLHPITDIMFHAQAGELALAQAAATNDWMVDEWLDREERVYGAITVPIEDGARAAEEIRRVGPNPRFVNVTLTVTTREPLGDPKYWPIYETAVEHGLPVVVHVGGFGGYAASFTATGEPSFFVERHTNWSLSYPQQVVSLLYSGVFTRLPELQIVLEEGALGWLPPLMWRLDRTWAAHREQVPHLTERPSTVIRNHFWMTTQPLDEPEKHEHLVQMLDHLAMDDRILYASDDPHHDFDAPDRVLPASVIGQERRKKILSTNAEHVFRFAA
jgi:predicted TIM-barrel fold metal-dependent hydrolase